MTISLCINNFLDHVLMMDLLCINKFLGSCINDKFIMY